MYDTDRPKMRKGLLVTLIFICFLVGYIEDIVCECEL